jgi:hypothetical protein
MVVDVAWRATADSATGAGATLAPSAEADVVGCAGARKMRKSSAPRRLSFQGKVRPGNPKVWPLMAMLNSSVWPSKDSNSAVCSRQGPR